eukprot:211952_1
MQDSVQINDAHSILSQVYGYLMILAVALTSASLPESTEIALSKFNYPFIMRYISMSSGIITSIPLLLCKLTTCNNTAILKSDKKRQFYLWALVGSICLTSGGMLSFLSFNGLSVPTATALGGTRAVCVLILSVCLVNEELTLWKIMAVIVSVCGILCYVYEADYQSATTSPSSGDKRAVHDTIWGCAFSLLANFMFAFCDVIAGKVGQTYNHKIMGPFYYQLWQGLYQIPIFLWVWWWPSTPTSWDNIWWCVLPAMALTCNNASVFIGVTIKSPFYVNIGTLLGIPLAFVVDIFVHDYQPTIVPILGAALLILSFLMLEVVQPPDAMSCCNYAFVNHKEDMFAYHKEDRMGDEEKEQLVVKEPVMKGKDELVRPLIFNTGEVPHLHLK